MSSIFDDEDDDLAGGASTPQAALVAAAQQEHTPPPRPLTALFRTARLCVELDERGHFAQYTDEDGARWVHAHSRPALLPGGIIASLNPSPDDAAVDYTVLTGAELLARIPTGTGVMLDPSEAHATAIITPLLPTTTTDTGSSADAAPVERLR